MTDMTPNPLNNRLVRYTINLTRSGQEAMAEAQRLTGDNKTDTTIRALRLYARVLRHLTRPGAKIILTAPGQPDREVEFL